VPSGRSWTKTVTSRPRSGGGRSAAGLSGGDLVAGQREATKADLGVPSLAIGASVATHRAERLARREPVELGLGPEVRGAGRHAHVADGGAGELLARVAQAAASRIVELHKPQRLDVDWLAGGHGLRVVEGHIRAHADRGWSAVTSKAESAQAAAV